MNAEVRALVVEALREAYEWGMNPERAPGPWTVQRHADDLLAALNKAGWAVVPREPTREMLDALYGAEFMRFEDAYAAMIAAGEARDE